MHIHKSVNAVLIELDVFIRQTTPDRGAHIASINKSLVGKSQDYLFGIKKIVRIQILPESAMAIQLFGVVLSFFQLPAVVLVNWLLERKGTS